MDFGVDCFDSFPFDPCGCVLVAGFGARSFFNILGELIAVLGVHVFE